MAPENVRTCRVASYQDAPFSRLLTSNHLSVSVIGYSVRLKGGVLTYRVEVSSVPYKSWFAGLYPEREVDARSGLGLGVRYR